MAEQSKFYMLPLTKPPAVPDPPAPRRGGAARLGAEDVPVDEPRLSSLLDSIDSGLKAPSQTFSVHIRQTHEQNGVNGPDRSSMTRFGLTASLIVFFYYERTEAESFFLTSLQ